MFPAALGTLPVPDVWEFSKILPPRPNASSGELSEATTAAITAALQSTAEEYHTERKATKPHGAAHTEAHCVPTSRMYGSASMLRIGSEGNRPVTAQALHATISSEA